MPFARINKIDLYYEVRGYGDPVVLLPGLGSDAGTWLPLAAEFDRYRVILTENRGAGRSAKPPGPYSTQLMAEDVAALMEHLSIQRAHVIGKSMGGMIAQFLAAQYPDRVRSLVLASTVMVHDEYGKELLELGRLVAGTAGMMATYRQAFLLSYSREYCSKNRSRLAEVEAMIQRMDSAEVVRGYHAQSLACETHDATAIAGEIKCPTLVLAGGEDLITPPQASRDLAAAIPRAELVILPRGGHGVWREFPAEVNAAVREFLARH